MKNRRVKFRTDRDGTIIAFENCGCEAEANTFRPCRIHQGDAHRAARLKAESLYHSIQNRFRQRCSKWMVCGLAICASGHSTNPGHIRTPRSIHRHRYFLGPVKCVGYQTVATRIVNPEPRSRFGSSAHLLRQVFDLWPYIFLAISILGSAYHLWR